MPTVTPTTRARRAQHQLHTLATCTASRISAAAVIFAAWLCGDVHLTGERHG